MSSFLNIRLDEVLAERARPRYVQQDNFYTCGPIAILNALKWAGENITKSRLKQIERACKTDRDNGTSRRDFERVLKRFGKGLFEVHRVLHPNMDDIERHLRSGGSAIVLHGYKDKDQKVDGHYVNLIDIRGQTYRVTNMIASDSDFDHDRETGRQMVQRRIMRRMRRGSVKYPLAWLLTKENPRGRSNDRTG